MKSQLPVLAERVSTDPYRTPADADAEQAAPKEPRYQRARRFLGGAVHYVADVIDAVSQGKAKLLTERVHRDADRIAPPDAGSEEADLLAHSREVAVFNDRLDVVSQLGRLSIDCMNGYGWSHVMSVPLKPATAILSIVSEPMRGKAGWRGLVADCQGHVHALEQTTNRLSRIASQAAKQAGDVADAQRDMEAARQDAHNALQSITMLLDRLVRGFDEYRLGRSPSPEPLPDETTTR